nr:receptor type tyrosine protein phosphatase [Hymenolepis microstoma]
MNRIPKTSKKPRQIKQSQFTSWPDCRAPEQPQPLLLFIRQACQARQALGPKQSLRGGQGNGVSANLLQNTLPNRLGSTVIHCSAGVGRPVGELELPQCAELSILSVCNSEFPNGKTWRIVLHHELNLKSLVSL